MSRPRRLSVPVLLLPLVAAAGGTAAAAAAPPRPPAFVPPVGVRSVAAAEVARPSSAASSIAASAASSSSDALPRLRRPPLRGSDDPAVSLVDPATGVEVVLVGCLHGSESSAADVTRALLGDDDEDEDEEDGEVEAATAPSDRRRRRRQQRRRRRSPPRTDAVVLELCAARFADVRNEMRSRSFSSSSSSRIASSLRDQETSDRADGSESGFGGLRGWAAGLPRFLESVRRTAEGRGLAAGSAALILGTAAGAQAALSGFEPGREFASAVECVIVGGDGDESAGTAATATTTTDVILADRTVDETLRRVGSLPSVSGGMMRSFLSSSSPRDWSGSAYGREARGLARAVWGDPDLLAAAAAASDGDGAPPPQVDMGRALTRSAAVRSDLARLTVPPLLLAEGLAALANRGLDSLTGGSASAAAAADGGQSASAALADISSTLTFSDVLHLGSVLASDAFTSAAILALGYVALVLPAARLIISERDEALAGGVRAACRLAAARARARGGEEEEAGRVVAVLGMLHVNGVARRLLLEEEEE